MIDDAVPSQETIVSWIEQIVEQGIRRSGYPADIWTERFCTEEFRRLGMQDVRLEPVPTLRWEPNDWSLEVLAGDAAPVVLDCFPVPFAAPVDGLELELAAFDPEDPAAVSGKASLYDIRLMRLPAALFMAVGDAPESQMASRRLDSANTLSQEVVLPFALERMQVMEPSMAAGASAFIGCLADYPGDSCDYFVPYDAVQRPIPGMWIRGSDGAWLHEQLTRGPVRVRLAVKSTCQPFQANTVVGELPGADEDMVIIGSHHDGPWASAVEDASGIALVLAQATYWASRPAAERPHRMAFVLHAGHMGTLGDPADARFIATHRAALDERLVLAVHLEHAASEFAEQDGELVATGLPVPRWFFTSRIPRLEEAVIGAIRAEHLERSMLLAPNAVGERPGTDAGGYHLAGYPIVQFLTAPFYLFDKMDTVDKIDQDGLVPITRTTIRILESTRGVAAGDMRGGAR
ncbi:hypothetical protein [Actinocrispum wychmicini]|uniref:Peptidase M28-like protein n=1 Tax=Actinocrispum wychmicini TaxID=1213861 RepID=A0A4R2JY38_9PSEU|nr:hypothetical protein [Actinocrispum wychmicini]TCO62149.1 hypothetical protein EV192_102286 [Actinocrispum wychmicini]